jgi:hypothetical protein
MKVDVLQVENVEIGRFSWWSKWVDVCVFDYECKPYLVQMKISRANGKKFRSIDITGSFLKLANTGQIGDLMPMNKSAYPL